ncbi:BOS complex subunit NOMO1 [Lutzomyia longipalpis]|uniref:BOS complex subunit NOMO1 n=1 Tax=Lutzomyia longipalpis TaxID=7200 RepID=UPI0024844EA4|nr:BOS complex subunit NOMO1 [Lutzomyia longipalpis]
MIRITFIEFSLIVLLIPLKLLTCEEILGCGGFIKSHASIDFSKVEIKLFTKQGSLKDKTDCSPSNGYYFLPLYDKGEYILKISPPPGWSFEPEEVKLDFNGETDICSQGRDVNFAFRGFGISGRIAILGQPHLGAQGVHVELHDSSNSKADVRLTTTDSSGSFFFTPVIPGLYKIRVHHDKWYFEKTEIAVEVNTGNTELPENSLQVSGFDIMGTVLSDGQSFGNIAIALLPEKGMKHSPKCISSQYTSTISSERGYSEMPLCVSMSDNETGSFTFSGVNPGKYLVKPFFPQSDVIYNIEPDAIEVTVEKDTVELRRHFEVKGFSVTGRILTNAINGKGVKNAMVKLNGLDVALTQDDGSYKFENIKSGTFTIQVTAENVQFTDQNVEIAAGNPRIPDIIVSEFKVCGQVVSSVSHRVVIKDLQEIFHVDLETPAGGSGGWCTYLPNGKYTVQVLLSDEEKMAGIQFIPKIQNINVNSSPLSGIVFRQLRATVVGDVKCLPDAKDSSGCKDITINLNSLDMSGNDNGQYISAVLKNGKYTFTDVMPGKYEASVQDTSLCWETSRYAFVVQSATETIPTFIHSGFKVTIIASHVVKMKYRWEKAPANATELVEKDLQIGLNFFCVPKEGVYNVEFDWNHQYDPKEIPKTFSTGATTPYFVTFSKHRSIFGRIEPPVEGARVKLHFPGNSEMADVETESNNRGEFKFTNVDASVEIEITATKESYEFTAFNRNTNTINAKKLCEIVATVRDDAGNLLSGVLLSLSGGESYRKNLVTGDDGVIKFHSLSPSEYFLRPMMKEYKFDPASKIIDVQEGSTTFVDLTGRRISFSIFGIVTTLNGEPFPNVLVEAFAQAPCPNHQEETNSEANGHFRIRGLQPGCTYDVQVKKGGGAGGNIQVDRTIPAKHKIEMKNADVKDASIIAISPLEFIDVTARVMASNNNHYKSLKISLFKKGNMDKPVYSQRIDSPLNPKSNINPGIMVFFPRIPFDGKSTYIVDLKTSLSEKNFKFNQPVAQFIANESTIFIELNFNADVRTTDGDLNPNSIVALVLILLIGFGFLKQDLVIELGRILWNKLNTIIQEAIDRRRKNEISKFDENFDEKELERLAKSINSVKKKKIKKIN